MTPAARRPLLCPLLLLGLALAVYLPSLRAPFIFDDFDAILRNATLAHPSQWLTPPRDSSVAGRPLVNLTFGINRLLGGDNPAGYRLVNILLHAASAVLLLSILRRTLASPRLAVTAGRGTGVIALAVAAIWTVHPLQTEAVVYITQRTELLMALFFLLCLDAAGRGMQSETRNAAGAWLGLSVVAVWLAAFSKEVAVAAPLVVLLWDRTFEAGSFRDAWRKRGFFYAMLAASWAVPIWVLMSGQRAASVGGGFEISPIQYLFTQSEVLLEYLRLCVWPTGLTISYEWPIARDLPRAADTFAVVAVLFALTGAALFRWPAAGFAGACFFLILGPTSSVLPIVTEVAAERRMYLPLASVLGLIVIGLLTLLRRRPGFTPPRGAALGAATVAVVLLAVASAARLQAYESSESIWRDALAKRPDNAVAHTALAYELGKQDRIDEAEAHLRRAIVARPDYVEAPHTLGLLLANRGELAEAIAMLSRAAELAPHRWDFRFSLGQQLLRARDLSSAVEHLEAAARILPEHPGIQSALGEAYLRGGRADLAIAPLRRAAELGDTQVATYANLGGALLVTQRPAEAIAPLLVATRMDASHLQAWFNLAMAFEKAGRWEDAIAAGERAHALARASGDAALAERTAADQDRRRRAIAP